LRRSPRRLATTRAHFEQEERQDAFEEIEEQPVERLDSIGAGQPADEQAADEQAADEQAADEQDDALAGEHLVQHCPPARLSVGTSGQNDQGNRMNVTPSREAERGRGRR